MKVYEIIFQGEKKGVFRVSLVKDPAVEATLMKFSAEEKPLYFLNEEKRIIYSVAMRPNMEIPRKNINGEPALVFYSDATVEMLQQNYFKQNGNSNTNINHQDENANGIFPFESWIVNNPDFDKSKELGLETKKGDWVMGYKIENDEVWQQVKDGNLDGLSVEMSGFELSEQKTNIKMSKLEKVIEAIKEVFASDVAPVEKTPEEIAAEEAAKMAEDMPPVEPPKDLEAENEMLKAKVAELEAKLAEIEAEKVKSETELETMKSEKESVIASFEKFKAETPAAAPIKNAPIEVVKTYEQMSNFERLQFNKEKKR